MRLNFTHFLVALANDLDHQGKFEQADEIDENFEEFINLLEKGEVAFDSTYYVGPRDPRKQRENLGRETTLSGITDSQ